MAKIKKAVRYFDKQVGHFTDIEKIIKIEEEISELAESIRSGSEKEIVDECSDVLTVAFHTATRNGYKGTPNDLFMQAYNKMKRRIESGERDYINRDF